MATDCQLNPRHEKNRHHLATAVVTLMAAVLLSLAVTFSLFSPVATIGQASVFALILIVRTFSVEAGVRRPKFDPIRAFNSRERSLLRRYFGITFIEDVPRLTN